MNPERDARITAKFFTTLRDLGVPVGSATAFTVAWLAGAHGQKVEDIETETEPSPSADCIVGIPGCQNKNHF